jgi:hypothetical protein
VSCSSAAHQAEYEQAYLFIDRQLQRLQPSAQPDVRQIIPLLEDFGALWQQMTLPKKQGNTPSAGRFYKACSPGCILIPIIYCGRWLHTTLLIGYWILPKPGLCKRGDMCEVYQ